MTSKWIVLDEIKLELEKDNKGTVELHDSKEVAILKAKCDSWQVVEIPFGEPKPILNCNDGVTDRYT